MCAAPQARRREGLKPNGRDDNVDTGRSPKARRRSRRHAQAYPQILCASLCIKDEDFMTALVIPCFAPGWAAICPAQRWPSVPWRLSHMLRSPLPLRSGDRLIWLFALVVVTGRGDAAPGFLTTGPNDATALGPVRSEPMTTASVPAGTGALA